MKYFHDWTICGSRDGKSGILECFDSYEHAVEKFDKTQFDIDRHGLHDTEWRACTLSNNNEVVAFKNRNKVSVSFKNHDLALTSEDCEKLREFINELHHWVKK